MGQRLIVHFKDDKGEDFLVAYFHWSAYTGSTFKTALEFYEQWRSDEGGGLHNGLPLKSRVLMSALRIWGPWGGGIIEGDLSQEKLEAHGFAGISVGDGLVKKFKDRSNGILAFSEKEMASLCSWEEGRLDIHFGGNGPDDLLFCTDVFAVLRPGDEYYDADAGIEAFPTEAESVSKLIDGNGDDLEPQDIRILLEVFSRAYRNGFAVRVRGRSEVVEMIA